MDHDQAPRWGAAHEDEGDQLFDKPKAKKTENLFSRHFLGSNILLPEAQNTHEDDDEDSPEGTKKKRFRKLFKKLFPLIATKDTPRSEQNSKPKRGLFAEFMPSSADDQTVASSEQNTSDISEKPSLQTEPVAVTEPGSTPERHEPSGSESIHIARVPEQTIHKTPTPETPQSPIDSMPAQPDRPTPTMDQLTMPAVMSRVEQNPVQPASIEKQPESKSGAGAIVAFLAAEFLSRRRDRKLKKEIKKLKTQTKKLDDTLHTRNKVEVTAATAPIKPESKPTKQAAPTEVHTSVPEVPPPIASPIILEKTAPPNEVRHNPEFPKAKTQQQEAIPKEKPELEGKTETLEEQNTRMDYFLKKREKQLEELRKVTEQHEVEINKSHDDTRREREFDSRHEVLDEPVASVSATEARLTPAASIGDVLKERGKTKTGGALPAKSTPDHDPKTNQNLPSLYQQSAQYGAAIGFIIALFAILIYFIAT